MEAIYLSLVHTGSWGNLLHEIPGKNQIKELKNNKPDQLEINYSIISVIFTGSWPVAENPPFTGLELTESVVTVVINQWDLLFFRLVISWFDVKKKEIGLFFTAATATHRGDMMTLSNIKRNPDILGAIDFPLFF